MVERFVLPERQPGSPQNAICDAGGSALEPPHYAGEIDSRFPEHMDMIGHNHPRVKMIEVADSLPVLEGIGDHGGDLRVKQPAWGVHGAG